MDRFLSFLPGWLQAFFTTISLIVGGAFWLYEEEIKQLMRARVSEYAEATSGASIADFAFTLTVICATLMALLSLASFIYQRSLPYGRKVQAENAVAELRSQLISEFWNWGGVDPAKMRSDYHNFKQEARKVLRWSPKSGQSDKLQATSRKE